VTETVAADPQGSGSAVPLPDCGGHSEPASLESSRLGVTGVLVWVVASVAVLVGLAMRGWFLFHRPVNGDEAIVGLMAEQILHGHFSAYYWGQSYGGGEPYLVAVLFGIFGTSVWALRAVPVLLSVVAAVLTWRIVRRMVVDPALAVLAGAAVWVFPRIAVSASTLELGFRSLTAACGLGLLLLALRIQMGDDRVAVFAGLGLVAGIGWWSSPEIVYYALPAGALVVVAMVGDTRAKRARRWLIGLVAAGVAAGAGSLPWLYTNAHSGFSSLRTGAFQVPRGSPAYVGRLKTFFEYSFPMLLNLRNRGNGHWLWGETVGLVVLSLFLVVLAAALVMCALAGARALILALGVMLFPFLVVLSPTSWFWQDGRYVVFVVPMLVIVLVVGCAEAARRVTRARGVAQRRISMGRWLASSLFAVVVAVGILNFGAFVNSLDTFFAGWTNPDAPTVRAISDLEASGIRYGYADYWVAYRMDLLSDGRLQITTAGADVDRWEALDAKVKRSLNTAWLFVPMTAAGVAQFADTTAIEGPADIAEPEFLSDLGRLGVPYRVVNAGLIRAVIPDRAVTPKEIGLASN
jgi:hypothetical protein